MTTASKDRMPWWRQIIFFKNVVALRTTASLLSIGLGTRLVTSLAPDSAEKVEDFTCTSFIRLQNTEIL